MIHNHQGFASGVIFIVAGTAFALLARSYRMGAAGSMGSGYFPFWLGMVLVLLDVVVVVQSVSRKGVVDHIPCWDVKALLQALSSMVLFGLLLQPLGLILSLMVLVLISSMAGHEFTLKGAAGAAIVMVMVSLATFVYRLKLQFPVWPAFIDN